MTTTTGCTIFPRHHHKHNSMAGERPPTTCWRIDRVALWLGSTLATFFFSTLDRCSCINIPTADDVDDGTGEAKNVPLIPRSEVGTEPFATSTAESPFRYRRKGRMKKVRVGFSFGLMRRKVGKPSSFRV